MNISLKCCQLLISFRFYDITPIKSHNIKEKSLKFRRKSYETYGINLY